MKKLRSILASVAAVVASLALVPAVTARTLDLPCMSTAIQSQAVGYLQAWDTFTAQVHTAKVSRKEAMKSAWVLLDRTQRDNFIRQIENTFRSSLRSANDQLRQSERFVETQFQTMQRACFR